MLKTNPDDAELIRDMPENMQPRMNMEGNSNDEGKFALENDDVHQHEYSFGLTYKNDFEAETDFAKSGLIYCLTKDQLTQKKKELGWEGDLMTDACLADITIFTDDVPPELQLNEESKEP